MLRWLPPPYPYVWSSGLVLFALCAVLADIRHVRQQRLNAAPTGVETILQAQQLTYVAEPVDEPRQLPIELIDPGLPLSLQESYAAQRSDYHPARAGQHAARRLPTPIPIDEDDEVEANVGRPTKREWPADRGDVDYETGSARSGEKPEPENDQQEVAAPRHFAPTLIAPDRSGFEWPRPAGEPVEQEKEERDVERDEEESDLLQEVLQRLPPTYPHSPRRFPEVSRSAEIQSAFISEDAPSDKRQPSPLALSAERPTRVANRLPAIPLFPAPKPAPVDKRGSNTFHSPYWSVTRWSRTTEVDRGAMDHSAQSE